MSMQILSGLSPPINRRMGAILPGLKGEAATPFRGQVLMDDELERSYQALAIYRSIHVLGERDP